MKMKVLFLLVATGFTIASATITRDAEAGAFGVTAELRVERCEEYGIDAQYVQIAVDLAVGQPGGFSRRRFSTQPHLSAQSDGLRRFYSAGALPLKS